MLKSYELLTKDPIDTFEWKYQPIEGIVWNPKGDLDDQEYYVKDAAQYSLVKDKEVILITIPDYDESKYPTYRFIVKNTFVGNKTLFCKSYYKEIT